MARTTLARTARERGDVERTEEPTPEEADAQEDGEQRVAGTQERQRRGMGGSGTGSVHRSDSFDARCYGRTERLFQAGDGFFPKPCVQTYDRAHEAQLAGVHRVGRDGLLPRA